MDKLSAQLRRKEASLQETQLDLSSLRRFQHLALGIVQKAVGNEGSNEQHAREKMSRESSTGDIGKRPASEGGLSTGLFTPRATGSR